MQKNLSAARKLRGLQMRLNMGKSIEAVRAMITRRKSLTNMSERDRTSETWRDIEESGGRGAAVPSAPDPRAQKIILGPCFALRPLPIADPPIGPIHLSALEAPCIPTKKLGTVVREVEGGRFIQVIRSGRLIIAISFEKNQSGFEKNRSDFEKNRSERRERKANRADADFGSPPRAP